MKFVVYSDPHAHPHQSYSTVEADGMNSRLNTIITAMERIYRYANENKLPVLCGGDLFQVKNAVNIIAFNEVAKILWLRSSFLEESPGPGPDIICAGNHDMATHDGSRHALEALELPQLHSPSTAHGRISTEVWNSVGGEKILIFIIPYPMEHGRFSRSKFEEILSLVPNAIAAENARGPVGTTILLSHLYTNELMRKHLDREGDYDGKALLEHFDLVLLGHHHVHDIITGDTDIKGRVKKVISIGSPVQLTAAERGDKKGFLVIDTDTLEVEFHSLESPEFHYYDGEKAIVPEKIKGDFVTVKVKSKAEATRVTAILEKAGVKHSRIEIIPETKTSRIDLRPGASDEEIIDKYISSEWGKTELDSIRLKKIGMKYVAA